MFPVCRKATNPLVFVVIIIKQVQAFVSPKMAADTSKQWPNELSPCVSTETIYSTYGEAVRGP